MFQFHFAPRTPYEYVESARVELIKQGYSEVFEDKILMPLPNKFFVVRDEKSLVVFDIHDKSKGLFVFTDMEEEKVVVLPNSQGFLDQWQGLNCAGETYPGEFAITGEVLFSKDGKVHMKTVNLPYETCLGMESEVIIARNDTCDAQEPLQSGSLMAALKQCVGGDKIIDFDLALVSKSPGYREECWCTAFEAFAEAGDCESGFKVFAMFPWNGSHSRCTLGSDFIEKFVALSGISAAALARSAAIRVDRIVGEPQPNTVRLYHSWSRSQFTDLETGIRVASIANEEDIVLIQLNSCVCQPVIYQPIGFLVRLGLPFVILSANSEQPFPESDFYSTSTPSFAQSELKLLLVRCFQRWNQME